MNQRTIEAQNKLLNSANESNLIYQYLGGGERTSELNEEESNNVEKVVKMFRKNIKLRNAMIQKNFWNRNYVNSGVTMIKITEMIPEMRMSKDIIAWINRYVYNENCKEVVCGLKSEVDYNSYPYIEKYCQICDNNEDVNLLLNPQKIYDKFSINKLIYSLVENIYKKIKKLKKELSLSTEHYINSFITIQKIDTKEIKCRLHTIIPNINFEFKQIESLPLSHDVKLNKLLVSNKKSIKTKNGDILTNGFLTMSNDKSIISLLDDTSNPHSKNTKKIIFGIWLSLKQDEVSSYQSIADIIERNKHFLYRKCFDFLNMSSKIETIYSPSPDEGIFLLAFFLKGGYLFFEVRVLPNEEDKKFSISNNSQYNLDTFTNQWLIIKRKFTIENNETIELDKNIYKVNYVTNYINKLNGITNISENSKKLLKSVISSSTVFTKLKAMSPNFDPMPELFEDSLSSDFFSNVKSQSNTSMLTQCEPIGPYNKSLVNKKTKANSSGCNKLKTFTLNIQPNNLNEKFKEKTQKPPIAFPSSRNNNMLYNINPISSEIFSQSTANYSRTQQQIKMQSVVHKKNLSFTNGKISKNDTATQTELTGEQIENSIMNSSQINNLNSIITEQSNSISFLTEKVAKLEFLFNQVVTILKEQKESKSLEKDLSEDDMDDQLSDSTDQKNEKSKETSLNIPQNQISILNASDSKSLPKIIYSSTLLSNTINE